MRFLKILTGLAVLLSAAVVLLFFSRRPERARPFAGSPGAARRIVVERGTERLELLREGDSWTVAAGTGPGWAADRERAEGLLGGLEKLEVEEVISLRADREADFEVTSSSGVRVSALGEGGRRLGEGIFGKSSPDGARIYFKYPDREGVYLARGLRRWELGEIGVDAWRSEMLFDFPETAVDRVLIEGAGFRTELTRSSQTWISADGAPVDSVAVWEYAGELARLRADGLIPARDSRAPERLKHARIVIERSGAAGELLIGALDRREKRYPVAVKGRPGTAWISEERMKEFLKPSFRGG